jgi:cell division protein FtsL
MKKPALLIIFLVLTIMILSLVRTFISNNVATSGVELGKIQNQVQKYKLENTILAVKLFDMTSLTNLAKKAYDEGYTEEQTNLVLSEKLPVAINR